MQIEDVALEVSLYKDNVLVKKFMWPCLLMDYLVKQYIAPTSGYKIVLADKREWNPYTKTIEI